MATMAGLPSSSSAILSFHHHSLSSSYRSSFLPSSLTPLHSSSVFPSLSATITVTTTTPFPPSVTSKPSLLRISSSSSSSPPPPPPSSLKKFSDTELLPLASGDLSAVPASPGVYAVFDPQAELQFVGISRRISDSLKVHLQALPQLCASVKFAVVEGEERSALIDAWKQWLEEYIGETGKVPPGNEDGNDLWKSKPKKAKEDLKLTPGRHVQLNVPIEKLIDIVVKEKKVIAFIKGSRTAPQCGFSHRVLTALNEQGVEYDTMNVLDEDHNFGLREALKTYSNWPTFPQVFVNGELVGGADIIEEMARSGELKALLHTST